jgi:5-oxoprolinase (ATP-hydrolysing)
VRFRKRDDDGQTMLVSVYPEGVNNPISGLFGGLPGGGARGRILDQEGRERRDCGTGQLVELTTTDEQVELVLAGGAGYGPASDRAGDALARDVALGFVSEAAARTAYGVKEA